jgi:hypothetical protein
MKEEAEQLIENIRNGNAEESDAIKLLENLRKVVQENPMMGREYGKLIANLSWALKLRQQKADLTLLPVGNGFLAIGHKPGGKISFDGMKQTGISTILTLLQENEGAAQIGIGTEKAGINWVLFPFSASKPHEGAEKTQVKKLYAHLKELLNEGHSIYIHCSAGIHRTGMISYGLLRYLGYASAEAKQLLKQLRDVTAEQVGEERLLWGDDFGN